MADRVSDERRGARPIRDGLLARAKGALIPLHVTLELTQRCNLSCVHCYLPPGRGLELPLERWLELVDEIADLGCLTMTLTGGEIALRDGWLQVAARARSRGILVGATTSGTRFTESDLDDVAEAGLSRVSVSVYSATPGEHDAVTGVPGSFEASVRSLRGLVARGVRCRVLTVLMSETLGGYGAVLDLAAELGCDFQLDPTVAPRADGSTDVLVHRVAAADLAQVLADRRLFDLAPDRSDPDWQPAVRERKANCSAGATSAFVEATGDVLPCMGFRPGFGNVRVTPFAAVWRSESADEHRRTVARALLACDGCDLLSDCESRCMRLALAEDGDVLGPSSRACEMAGVIRGLRSTTKT